ncbi:MAG: 23S rRNA (uracil1939-C5)-methyltransferase [Salibacteraceae bacterium]|jgi:23S rRNA (uracil1939-C5)-methyltransferase
MDVTKLKKGNIVELEIKDLAFGGKGISKIPTADGEYIIFVLNTFPGQTVKARIIKKKRRYAEAKVTELIAASPDEQPIKYQAIPGAPYATWPVAKQQEHKKTSTLGVLQRIGGVSNAFDLFDEFIASPLDWHYRNKMEYSFSTIIWDKQQQTDIDEFGLGFKHRGQWRVVDNLDADSGLFDTQIEDGVKRVREWCIKSNLPAWHPVRHHGFYRFLTVRKSFYTNKILYKLTTSSSHVEDFDPHGFISLLQEIVGDRLGGVIHTINDGQGDRTQDEDLSSTVIYGEDNLEEKIHDLHFNVSIGSFFQPNPQSAELLYQKAIDYTFLDQDFTKEDTIVDLFCGTGTIGQLVANQAKGGVKVIGVDIIKKAIEDAKKNAKKNGIKNLEFYAADVKNFLKDHPEYQGNIKTVILDPPRSGITPKALKLIIDLAAKRVVYISCNPATQARDLLEFHEAGYVEKQISIVDQFVHTAHVESVVLLEKGNR